MEEGSGNIGKALARWSLLLGVTAGLAVILELLRLPAAPLLAAILAGIAFSLRGAAFSIPRPLFALAQGVLGCVISRSFTASVISDLVDIWPLALFSVLSGTFTAALLGWYITVRRILPGTTAIWGISPGGALAMPIMSAFYGGDMSLVAFMQYLRMLIVAAIASMVAGVMDLGGGGPVFSLAAFFPPFDALDFLIRFAFAAACAGLGVLSRVPAGSLLLPVVLGAVLGNFGILRLEFPLWFLLLNYAAIGWMIGMGFSREQFRHARHAIPVILLAMAALIGVCGLVGAAMVVFAGIDPLTAYLATSPGGADSIAVIAASTDADAGFVMSLQAARLFTVLLLGPHLARLISRRVSGQGKGPPHG